MKHLLTILFIFCCLKSHAQNLSSLQFRFRHNGHSFKRTVIQFGAMFQHTTSSQKVTDAGLLGVKIVRTNLNFYSWNGTNSPESDTITSHGLINYLNIAEIPNDGSGYNTIDTAAWASHLTTLAAHSDPSKVVWIIFNEMGNRGYWNVTTPTDMLPYIWCAKIAVRIGHQHGFKVFDGGFTSDELVYWTYRQMSNSGDADTTNFLQYCIPVAYQFGVTHRTNSAVNEQVDNMDYLLTQFTSVDFDGNNMHLYLPFTKSFVDTATNYSTAYTGLDQIFYYFGLHSSKPIITNEFGVIDASFIAPVLAKLRQHNVRIVIYYNDPTQASIIPVVDDFNAVTSFGNTFKNIR